MKRILVTLLVLVWLSLPAHAVRRQYFNLDVSSAELKTVNGGQVQAQDVTLFTRDESVLCFYFQEYDQDTFSWTPFVVPSDADLKFGMKQSTNRSGDYIVFSDNDKWNISGDWNQAARTNGRMSVRVNCNTTAITSLFTSATTYLDFLCEIQMTEAGATNPTTLAQFDARITHDIIQGGEGVSTAAAPTYVTQPALAAHAGDTNNPHGVTAAQISALPSAGGALTGALDMTGHIISNAILIDVDGSGLTGVPVVVTGNLDMQGNTISNATMQGVDGTGITNLNLEGWSATKAVSAVDMDGFCIVDADEIAAGSLTLYGIGTVPSLYADEIDGVGASNPVYVLRDLYFENGTGISNAEVIRANNYYGPATHLSGFDGDVSGVGSNLQIAAGAVGPDELAMGELQSVFMLSGGTNRFDRLVVADIESVTTNLLLNGTFDSDASGWAVLSNAYWAAPGRIQVLEGNTGFLQYSSFSADAGAAYKLSFKKGTTYSSISVGLGGKTNSYDAALYGTMVDYFYCETTGALTFAMTVGTEPDIFQYVDDVELYQITNGTMQVVGDLYVDGKLHADGLSAENFVTNHQANVSLSGTFTGTYAGTGHFLGAGVDIGAETAFNRLTSGLYVRSPYWYDAVASSVQATYLPYPGIQTNSVGYLTDPPNAYCRQVILYTNDISDATASAFYESYQSGAGTEYYQAETLWNIYVYFPNTNITTPQSISIGGDVVDLSGWNGCLYQTNYVGPSPLGYVSATFDVDVVSPADQGIVMIAAKITHNYAAFDGPVVSRNSNSTYVGSFYGNFVAPLLPTNEPSRVGQFWVSNGVVHASGY